MWEPVQHIWDKRNQKKTTNIGIKAAVQINTPKFMGKKNNPDLESLQKKNVFLLLNCKANFLTV